MAPVLEKRLAGAAGAAENNNEDEEGQNLWQVLLLSELTAARPDPVPGEAEPQWFCFVTAG